MNPPKDPPNFLYPLLLAASGVFVVTALAYAVVPVLEQKALDAGQAPPPSLFRDALRTDGWRWLLVELAAMIVLGLASMGLDRWRRWRREHP
jgi:predicted lysophospholipase L1 biosynthesis ABC-type transport system permease subunit